MAVRDQFKRRKKLSENLGCLKLTESTISVVPLGYSCFLVSKAEPWWESIMLGHTISEFTGASPE